MAEYQVGHDYSARYGSTVLAFTKGTKVEVDDAVAEWVNNDSPGTLVTPKPAAKKSVK